jgi:hypothetical protein
MASATPEAGSLIGLVHKFVADMVPTFPEAAEALEKVTLLTEEQFIEATAPHYAGSFFYLLQKNDEVFSTGSDPLMFLPGIDFRPLWNADGLSDATRDAIWRHLQLVMFELVPRVTDKTQFGDSATLFEAITPEQLQEELEAAFAGLEEGAEGVDGTEVPDAEAAAGQFTEHISGLMGGSLGRLAGEIAEEVGQDLGLTRDATQKEVMDLLRDPTRMIKLVKTIGKRLEEKIASGEVKESELLEEAAGVVGKLKDVPGADRLRQMFGSAASSKASQAATSAALKQRIGKAKQRERLQAKLAAKRAERAAAQAKQEGVVGANGGGGGGSAAAAGGSGAAAAGSGANEWLSEDTVAQPRSAPRRKKQNKKKR